LNYSSLSIAFGRARLLSNQRGVTLIELMVAMALGLLIIGAVGYVYLQGSQGFRVQDAQSRMQEDARFIIDTVGRDVRMAGSFGCATPRGLKPLPGGTEATSFEAIASQPIMTVDTTWLMLSGVDTAVSDRYIDLQYVLRGFSPTAATTAKPLPSYVQTTSRQPNTDVLMIMRAGDDARTAIANPDLSTAEVSVSVTGDSIFIDGPLTPKRDAAPVLVAGDCRYTKIIKPTVEQKATGVLLKIANGMNRNNNAPSGTIDYLPLEKGTGQFGPITVSHFEPVIYFVAKPATASLRPTLRRVGIANDPASNWGGWEATGGSDLLASGVEAFSLSFIVTGDPTVVASSGEFTLAQMEAGPTINWSSVSAVRLQFTLSAESDGTALTAQSNSKGGVVRSDKRLVQRYDVTLGIASRQNSTISK
jgi:prepilin-type N-terminal cleavage/methylation domain-containing protein